MDRKLLGGLGLYRLGVDFGTSSTVAMVSWLDGRARPLLFDGTPMLPSAVCGQPTGGLLVGGDAVNAATTYPGRFEPYPKRRVDDVVVLLGENDTAVVDMIGAVLRRVADEARRVTGGPPAEVVLTHPVSWGARRRETLLAAAASAGIVNARLVAEPVAAGHYFVTTFGGGMPLGGHLLVYDLGAGTFDASVLRRVSDGFVVLASEGLADAGGLDVDAAVMAHLAASYSGRDAQTWARLSAPATPADRRRSREAWDAVRTAKETLSRTGSTLVHLPALDQDVPLGREQLDALARPILDRTVTAARTVLLEAGVPAAGLTAILLVGGATRMPLVATLLHRAFGTAPAAIDQPELVVAEGSLAIAAVPPRSPTGAATDTRGLPTANGGGGRSRRRALIIIGAVAMALWLVAGLATLPIIGGRSVAESLLGGGPARDRGEPGGRASSTPSGSADGLVQGGLPAGPSGAVPGSPGPGGTRSGPPRPGDTPGPGATGGGSTKAPGPTPVGTNPLTGPAPKATDTWKDSLGGHCQRVYLRLTRTAGSSTTWPEPFIQACVIEGSTGAESDGTVHLAQTSLDQSPDEIRLEFSLEFRRCGGDVLEIQRTGKVVVRNYNSKSTHTKKYPIDPQAQARVSLASLEIHHDGSVWTTGAATAISPCD